MEALLNLLRIEMGADRWANCSVRMLNSGTLQVQNTSTGQAWNRTSNTPSFFIWCADNSTLEYKALVDVLRNHTLPTFGVYIQKDGFSAGCLMASFILCIVCAGSWMLLLVLLMLPANNHNHRKKMVYLGVVYQAIWHTVILDRSMDTVFEEQYKGNYQNGGAFYNKVMDSTLYSVMLFFATVISNLNWLDIVYYMFHNYRKINSSWVPRLFNNRNKRIIAVGLALTCAQAVLKAVKLWGARRHVDTVNIVLRSVDFTIYSLFSLSVVYYVWHDFGFTLEPQKRQRARSWRALFVFIWNDYHETVLLLLYNAVVMALLYMCTILLITMPRHVFTWMQSLISFLNVLVTVNTWGLIGVLERRERTLSKETVLGRKINNRDKFFVDPQVDYDQGDSPAVSDDLALAPDTATVQNSVHRRFGLVPVLRPAKALRSKLAAKRRKGGGTSKRQDKGSASEPQSSRHSIGERRASTEQEWTQDGDNESAETLLTRNYIYDHDG
ncbi:LAQU0S10e01200g1_1 [Lachancea quebecensis]|uniref:LAQU0S10e01200g1_1 n=1 Tax=Lachancea quebecensis TaxID=1654605 RepID=A0A0P1KTT2_9SACH|nr:LAQU0S10e01200g1_1 [Lachancea quebecensis]